jgi:ribosomal protein S18 acetylase RimI-like enzyme
MPVEILNPAHTDEIVSVLCDAFHDYPVMRFVLGSAADYDRRLTTLIGVFVGDPVPGEAYLGVRDDTGRLAGAAVMNPSDREDTPGTPGPREELGWAELGNDARERHQAYVTARQRFSPPTAHHELNMIGVRGACAGTGLGRRLLDGVRAVAEADPASAGVLLATERRENVEWYRRFGYQVIGNATVAGQFETWVMFRRR